MTKLILSLDGGGIRGAATAQFLARVEKELEENHQTSLRDCVDFYAGTSTGAIIALGLATTDLTMAQICNLYNYQNASKIFSDNKGWFEIDGINAPKYEAKGKTKVLKDNLGDAKIGDVPDDKHVLAVTYAVEKRKPVVIKSTKREHRRLRTHDVADATSAAPTYFPTHAMTIDEEYWLVDGGVTANNPAMCAIAEARKAWPDVSLDNIRMLSIGTGYRTRRIDGKDSQKWGAVGWVTQGKLIDLLSDERVVEYQAKTIMNGGSYIRINSELRDYPTLPKSPNDEMDYITRDNIKLLKILGDFWYDQYGTDVIQFLLNNYDGPSLDSINRETGRPEVV
ncbi:patatin-like phospholipase family protein [Vibrio alfacsensis]|uniref:patatin-like phospholipase family protein n=1 Tax=Vibrio alfacsensis TaxID=1074311 RepID=UPI004068E28B